MVFYLDLILLLNFMLDYFLLLATGKLLNRPVKHLRIALAAGVGALYTLSFFLPKQSFFSLFISKLLLSLVIILIAFGFKHLLAFVQTLATFYMISFITGGGVIAVQYFFNIQHDVVNGIYISRSSSPVLILTLIVVAFGRVLYFAKGTVKSLTRKNIVQQKIVEVEVFINEQSYLCKGLIDTGNQLYDPITRKPVMIIEAERLDLIPKLFSEMYIEGQFQLDLFDKITEQLEAKWLRRISLVPFRSVSRDMQFILTIRPDKVVIHTEDSKQVCKTKVLIGLDYGNLSNDQTYQAIIHPDLLVG